MNIGILTFHDGPNHGAFLQAWSTYRSLEKKGHSVEIINYKNPLHHEMEKGGGVRGFLRNPFYAWGQLCKRRVFEIARNAFRMSPYVTNEKELAALHYDTVVIGSDVVWNYEIFGYDPVFFGAVNADRIIAYSASFGSVSKKAEHPQRMAEDLEKLAAIAVRDENSQAIVHTALGEKPTLTLDPTLIYDFTEDLDKVQPAVSSANYLLVYSYHHSYGFIDTVRKHAMEMDLKVICVGYPPPLRAPRYCASIDMKVGPFEWVQLFKDAHTIATSTFHGVVFSLKSKKPFFYITNDKAHNRVSSLLDLCGIEHSLNLGEEGQVHFFEPDYTQVNARLKPLIEFSSNWLFDNV